MRHRIVSQLLTQFCMPDKLVSSEAGMAGTVESIAIGLAAEIFVATALLHREQPDRADFEIREIVNRAARENMAGEVRSGLNVHASMHCVANRPPNPAKHRMLFATGKHTRRLLLPGDEVHPGRTGKAFPDAGEIPERYQPLLEWAKKRYGEGFGTRKRSSGAGSEKHNAPKQTPETPQGWLEGLLEMEGLGKEYWKRIDPDEFVRKLREGWE
jgi:hypothetical protein